MNLNLQRILQIALKKPNYKVRFYINFNKNFNIRNVVVQECSISRSRISHVRAKNQQLREEVAQLVSLFPEIQYLFHVLRKTQIETHAEVVLEHKILESKKKQSTTELEALRAIVESKRQKLV